MTVRMMLNFFTVIVNTSYTQGNIKQIVNSYNDVFFLMFTCIDISIVLFIN